MVRFRRILLVSSVVVLAFLLAGCVGGSGGSNTRGVSGESDEAETSGSITVAGSTSVQPIAEMLAQTFEEDHPDARINVQGGGSTAGIKAVSEGAADIGTSSRELVPEEKGLIETTIARDAIAVVVHPSNPLDDLTLDQLRSVFSGEVTDWSDLVGTTSSAAGATKRGVRSEKIVLVNREAGSGTRGAFEEIVMGSGQIDSRAIVQGSTGAVRQAVSLDPNAIGYVSLASVNDDVKVLSIDGVVPSEETVAGGTYGISRPFLMLTRQEPEGLVAEFLRFVLSGDGQELVFEEGLVPVSESDGEK